MNILATILTVLTIPILVHSFNVTLVQQLVKNVIQCGKEHRIIPGTISVTMMKCLLIKDGGILNEKSEYIMPAALQRLDDLIPDPEKVTAGQELLIRCHNRAVQSRATGEEQTIKIILCSLPAVFYINLRGLLAQLHRFPNFLTNNT